MIAEVPSPRGYAGATLTLDIDEAEHERRQAAGLGVATGHGFGGLDVLMSLPEGLPVPLAALTDQQRKYVRRAPAALCRVEDGQVTRLVVRPCRVTMATVRFDTTYKMALHSASRFAPFCARQLIVKRLPKRAFDRVNDEMEFEFYGIGILLEHPDGTLESVVEPQPWRPQRHTPAGWYFAETAYRQFLDRLSPDPLPR